MLLRLRFPLEQPFGPDFGRACCCVARYAAPPHGSAGCDEEEERFESLEDLLPPTCLVLFKGLLLLGKFALHTVVRRINLREQHLFPAVKNHSCHRRCFICFQHPLSFGARNRGSVRDHFPRFPAATLDGQSRTSLQRSLFHSNELESRRPSIALCQSHLTCIGRSDPSIAFSQDRSSLS